MRAPEAATEIKNLLVRKYWSRRKQLTVDISGTSATFSTADYYSNCWFFGSQNLEAVYEPAISRLLIENIGKARAFADLGANLGYFTVLAAIAAMHLFKLHVRLNERSNVCASSFGIRSLITSLGLHLALVKATRRTSVRA